MPDPIILTGDWQLDVSCLELVEQTVTDIIAHAQTHGVKNLIHTGDVKDALSPIDGRVINSMVRQAERLRAAGLTVYCTLGNHDYYATTAGSQSWLGFLRSLGWHVFDTPDKRHISGWDFFFFPFSFDVEKLREDLKNFGPVKSNSALPAIQIFHQGIMGARLSVLRRADTEALTVDDLHPERYAFSVGGHFHDQHHVERGVWYCGSPFCTSWAEANQTKGFFLLRASKDGFHLDSLRSSIPGWYDPAWPDFPAVVPTGARVRVHVPMELGVNPTAAIDRHTIIAETKYEGAVIHAVPKPITHTTLVGEVQGDSSDASLVDMYVDGTFDKLDPDTRFELRDYIHRVVGAMSTHRRADLQVHFKTLEAENWLSFEKLFIDYEKPGGIRVVTGTNLDRPGHSNGSGKTAYIHALLAVLTGETLKEQKHGGLKRRGIGARVRSFGKLTCTLGDGREMVIERSRQPVYVKLWVGGADESTGKGDQEIQRTIAKLTGFNLEVAGAALYVDQREVNQLLVGRDAERKAVLAAFLNLERFAKGLVSVKADVTNLLDYIRNLDSTAQAEQRLLESYRGTLATLTNRREDEAAQWDAEAARLAGERTKHADAWKVAKAAHTAAHNAETAQAGLVQTAQQAYDKARIESSTHGSRKTSAELDLSAAQRAQPTTCPTCGGPLQVKDRTALIADAKKRVATHTKAHADAVKLEAPLLAALQVAQRPMPGLRDATQEAYSKVQVAEQAGRTAATQQAAAVAKAAELRSGQRADEGQYKVKVLRSQAYLRNFPRMRQAFDEDLGVLNLAARALSRDGIPSLVASMLCPRLNQSAAYYSRVLGDGAISVEFVMDGEDLMVQMQNPMGGENVKDQSAGELRIAALITTLALRDSVRTNVLFLDEMSLGLDGAGARDLARGISQMGERFPSIFITSHDANVMNGLQDYTTIEVVKENGISRVQDSPGLLTAHSGAQATEGQLHTAGQSRSPSDAGESAGASPKRRQRAGRL